MDLQCVIMCLQPPEHNAIFHVELGILYLMIMNKYSPGAQTGLDLHTYDFLPHPRKITQLSLFSEVEPPDLLPDDFSPHFSFSSEFTAEFQQGNAKLCLLQHPGFRSKESGC